MSYQLSSFRRFPTAFAVVAASALAFTGLIAAWAALRLPPEGKPEAL